TSLAASSTLGRASLRMSAILASCSSVRLRSWILSAGPAGAFCAESFPGAHTTTATANTVSRLLMTRLLPPSREQHLSSCLSSQDKTARAKSVAVSFRGPFLRRGLANLLGRIHDREGLPQSSMRISGPNHATIFPRLHRPPRRPRSHG